MRTLVIGCGSIGARRARILADMGCEVHVYDADEAKAERLMAEDPRIRITDMRTGLWDWGPDAAVICTPAWDHIRTARECAESDSYHRPLRGIFVEKPLATSMAGVRELVEATRGITTMGACNMRWAYDAIPRDRWYERPFLTVSKPLSEWRDGAPLAYKRNGVILEAAIHEIDMATVLCGPITGCEAFGDDEQVGVMLRHHGGPESLVVADWSEEAETERCITITSEIYEPDISDAMYRSEMAHFLERVEAGAPTCNPLSHAAHVLEWALAARAQTMEKAA